MSIKYQKANKKKKKAPGREECNSRAELFLPVTNQTPDKAAYSTRPLQSQQEPFSSGFAAAP